jgi:FemAB-related protein (PEP-CTERM system-associated)
VATEVSSPESSVSSGVGPLAVWTHGPGEFAGQHARLQAYVERARTLLPASRALGWLSVLSGALKHEPHCLEAVEHGNTVGVLPLAFVRSLLFGRFLVSVPYLNSGGVVADSAAAAAALVDRAVELADRLDVRYLELRHERDLDHAALTQTRTDKVHMRLELPASSEQLWSGLSAKVRNQVRKGERNELGVSWGGRELLDDFYAVFSHNMRDLGTPVYPRGLFGCILQEFAGRAELCVVRSGRQPLAGALVLHGRGVTEVPSASSLRRYNPTNANMLMYWHMLKRAIERGQRVFDFGRSSLDSNTYRFKRQWGSEPEPAPWQYYVRRGLPGELRPDNPKHQRRIRLWRRLPVALTRLIGPIIVRGIP